MFQKMRRSWFHQLILGASLEGTRQFVNHLILIMWDCFVPHNDAPGSAALTLN